MPEIPLPPLQIIGQCVAILSGICVIIHFIVTYRHSFKRGPTFIWEHKEYVAVVLLVTIGLWGQILTLKRLYLYHAIITKEASVIDSQYKFITKWQDKLTDLLLNETSERLENLPQGVEFPNSLKDKISYDTERKVLIFEGVMSVDEKDKLLILSQDKRYKEVVEVLFQRSQKSERNKLEAPGEYTYESAKIEAQRLDLIALLLNAVNKKKW
jgi:hypothetical protein